MKTWLDQASLWNYVQTEALYWYDFLCILNSSIYDDIITMHMKGIHMSYDVVRCFGSGFASSFALPGYTSTRCIETHPGFQGHVNCLSRHYYGNTLHHEASEDPKHGTQKRSEIPCVWTSETWDLRISMVHVWSSTYELTWKHVIADDRNISNISPLASLLVISVKLALWHPMVLTPFQAAMHLSSVVPCRDMIPLFSIRAMETKLWFGTSTG